MPRSRRLAPVFAALALVAGASTYWVAGYGDALPAVAQGAGPDPAGVRLRLEPVVESLAGPVAVTHAGDGSGRLFIVEKAGRIRILRDGVLASAPFLDIEDRVESGASERGLLGLAFHPDYESNGLLYVNYTTKARQGLDNGDTVIARYTVTEDPDVADPASETRVLTYAQPFPNHNGGDLRFGPDGYLYIGTGDGGAGGDPQNNAQTGSSLLGKMLRIDVDAGGPDAAYGIPPDNPFIEVEGVREEIWATGLRNPWRYAFDAATGDLYIGDVGQGALEEVDFQPADSSGGENYGWRLMEGTRCFNPSSGCNPDGDLVLPVAEYGRDLGISITGGEVYRGEARPALHGLYLYADYGSGRIWGLSRDEDGIWRDAMILDSPYNIATFGADEDGELYLTDYSARGPGGLYALVFEDDAGPTPETPATPLPDTPTPSPPSATPEPTEPTETATATATPQPLLFLPLTLNAEGE